MPIHPWSRSHRSQVAPTDLSAQSIGLNQRLQNEGSDRAIKT